jgi:hypothetical protein
MAKNRKDEAAVSETGLSRLTVDVDIKIPSIT